MKKKVKKITRVKTYRKTSHNWLKRFFAFLVILVLVGGFGVICVSFAKSSAAVLGAHIVVTK